MYDSDEQVDVFYAALLTSASVFSDPGRINHTALRAVFVSVTLRVQSAEGERLLSWTSV